jgi:hypothetical protein
MLFEMLELLATSHCSREYMANMRLLEDYEVAKI